MTRVQTNRSATPIPTTDDPGDIPFAAPPANGPWITDDAWFCGAVGAFMVLATALLYIVTGALTKGVTIAVLPLTAGEYGYRQNSGYYQVWFRFLDLAWSAYLWAGLPYVLVTRAVIYDAVADRRDFSALTARVIRFLISWIPGLKRFRTDQFPPPGHGPLLSGLLPAGAVSFSSRGYIRR